MFSRPQNGDVTRCLVPTVALLLAYCDASPGSLANILYFGNVVREVAGKFCGIWLLSHCVCCICMELRLLMWLQ